MTKKPRKTVQEPLPKHSSEAQELMRDHTQAVAIEAFNTSLRIVRDAMKRLHEKSK